MEENKTVVTTTSGFECEVNMDVMDDVDVFEDLVLIQTEGTPLEVVMAANMRIFKAMIGEDQYKSLKDHLKKIEGGRAKLTSFQRELTEVFAFLKDKKK